MNYDDWKQDDWRRCYDCGARYLDEHQCEDPECDEAPLGDEVEGDDECD